MAKYKAYKLPSGKELRFPPNSSNEQIRNYIVSNYGEQALRPAPTVMTDAQRQQAQELAKQYEQPKSFGDKVSEWAVTSPLGRGIGLGLQGVANSFLNPAGYIARGMGVDTKPLEPQNTTERVIEAGTGALYDTAMFMPVGKAVGGSQLVGNLANSSNKAVSLAGKGIKALATPAAPAYELAGGVGGASLPAAVNLQAPSEDASFGDKAKYYAANTVLALLGGLGGAGIVGGGRALAKKGLNKYGVNADGSLDLDLPKETVKPKSSAEVLAEEGLKPVEITEDMLNSYKPESKFNPNTKYSRADSLIALQKRADNMGVKLHNDIDEVKDAQLKLIRKREKKGDIDQYFRNSNEIKTFEEALQDVGSIGYNKTEIDEINKIANKALKDGKIKVYSDEDIEKGAFGALISPSKDRMIHYAKDGVVYELEVPFQDVAWSSPMEGQYAPVKKGLGHFLKKEDRLPFVRTLENTVTNPDVKFIQSDGSTIYSKKYGNIPEKPFDYVVYDETGNPYTKYMTDAEYLSGNIKAADNISINGRVMDSTNVGYVAPYPKPNANISPLEGNVKSETLPQTPLNPEKGISKLTSKERLAQNPNLSAEAKANLKDSATYDILHNQDLTMQAIADVNANPDMVRNSLLEKDFYTAQDFEDARLLASRLFSEGKTEDALTLIRTVSEKGSKAGQSVQAMSLWSQMTPEGAVRNAQRNIDEYNALNPDKPVELTPEQTKKIMDLQTKAMSLPDGSREKDVYAALSLKAQEEPIPTSLGDKIRSYRNQSMLLNPKTLGRNILGNLSFASVEKGLTDPVAAMIDKGISKFTGKQTRAMPQYLDYLKGLGKGAKYGVEDVNMGINTRKLGGRFDSGTRPSFDGGVLGKTEKALAYGLQVPDRAFYEATYAESLANQMKAKGVKKATKEMENVAEQEALESVFQNKSLLSDTIGSFRGGINRASKKGLEAMGINLSDGSLGLGDLLIPYAQTPANLAQQTINYSPLGMVKGGVNLARGNQRQATKDIARSLVGTGGMYGGYELAKHGLLTGDLNDPNLSQRENMERRRNLELLGVRPNQVKLGDKGYSYGFLNPMSAPIAAGAKFAEGGDTMDSLIAAGSTLTELPMLSNVNKFGRDLVYSGLGGAVENQVAGLPSQFVPTISSQVADLIDDTAKETYDPSKLKQGLNVALNKIPFARSVLPNRIDVMGNKMQKYDSEGLGKFYDAMINPTFVEERVNNPVVQELERLYQETGESSQFLPLAERKITSNGSKRVLKPNEVVAYQTILGGSNYEALKDMISSRYYQSLPDNKKVELIGKLQKGINQQTKERLFTGSKKETIKDKTIKKIERKINRPVNELLKLQINNVVNDNINDFTKNNRL